jgi:hypothetical protein
MPVGYQDQHMLAHQEYAGAIPQGFGEINGAYMQQTPMQQHQGHHLHQQGGQQSHGKGAAQGSSAQQTHGQRGGNAAAQGYANAAGGAREHGTSPPGPNVSAGMSASYAQHYGWASYGGQPMGGWGHMIPQGYQQTPSPHQQQQQQQQQQHPGSHHQQSYRQYGNSSAQSGGNASADASSNAHSWSS